MRANCAPRWDLQSGLVSMPDEVIESRQASLCPFAHVNDNIDI